MPRELIYKDEALGAILKANSMFAYCINNIKPVDAVPVSDIKAYLQARLDEWNALGDRKWEPANAWGYNFIMACFDDLETMYGEKDGK